MAYTDSDKVKSMFREIKIEASDTVILTSEVDEFIAEVDAEIDAKLDAYYVTPITGANSLLIVGKISKLKVAHTIKTILEMQAETSDTEQDVQINLDKKAEKMLQDLLPQYNKSAKRWEKAIMPLPDAEMKDFPPSGASLFSYNSDQSATIEKGGDNW